MRGRFIFQLTGGQLSEIRVDEAVQIAVHNVVDVAGLIAGAGVLHHLVGHEHVGADLAAPLDLHLHALDIGDLLRVLLLLQLHQLGPQHLHAVVLVLKLAALLLAGHHDARGLVDEAHGG